MYIIGRGNNIERIMSTCDTRSSGIMRIFPIEYTAFRLLPFFKFTITRFR